MKVPLQTKKHLLNNILDVKTKLKTHMEQNESNLSFDQLPKAVGELLTYRKRGNKLYFFKKELVEWIQSGGAYDKPYTLSEQEQAEFDTHLEQMREKKRHKPAAVQQQ